MKDTESSSRSNKMHRDPSIHLKESDLAIAIQEVLEDKEYVKPDFIWFDYKLCAQRILKKVKTKSVASRSIISSTKKMEEKVEKVKLAGRSQTGMFAQILLLTRRKLHHRGLQLIEPGMPEWLNLKETCKLATEFANEFEVDIKTGYTEYLKIAAGMMKNFGLNKIKGMHTAICNIFEAQQEIASDHSPARTTMFYDLYLRKINQKLGWESNDYKDNPTKYVCFVRAKNAADKIKIKYEDYIAAQFAALEWGDRSSIPDPHQLYGDKAIERVRKYCYQNNITLGSNKPKVNFQKIRNGKKG